MQLQLTLLIPKLTFLSLCKQQTIHPGGPNAHSLLPTHYRKELTRKNVMIIIWGKSRGLKILTIVNTLSQNC